MQHLVVKSFCIYPFWTLSPCRPCHRQEAWSCCYQTQVTVKKTLVDRQKVHPITFQFWCHLPGSQLTDWCSDRWGQLFVTPSTMLDVSEADTRPTSVTDPLLIISLGDSEESHPAVFQSQLRLWQAMQQGIRHRRLVKLFMACQRWQNKITSCSSALGGPNADRYLLAPWQKALMLKQQLEPVFKCCILQRSFSFLNASFSSSVVFRVGGRKWDMTMRNCSKSISSKEPVSPSRWFLRHRTNTAAISQMWLSEGLQQHLNFLSVFNPSQCFF